MIQELFIQFSPYKIAFTLSVLWKSEFGSQFKLITWLKDESVEDADSFPEPNILATEAITELEAVVDDLRDILTLLESDRNGE